MIAQEAAALCRFAKACCPQQKFDEFTPDAWMELFGDLRFEDCKQAMFNVAKQQPFVAPSEIRAEVGRIRRDRIDTAGPIEPPPGLTELEYRRWNRAKITALANGDPPEPRPVGAKPMPVIEGTFKEVPNA